MPWGVVQMTTSYDVFFLDAGTAGGCVNEY